MSWLFTLLATNLAVSLACAGALQNHPVTAFVDTRLIDPRYGSRVRARIDGICLENLAAIALETKDGVDLLAVKRNKPIEVTIVVPAGLDRAERDAFIANVKETLRQRFQKAAFKIQRSYIPAALEHTRLSDSQSANTEKWRQWANHIARSIHRDSLEPEKVDLFFGSVIGQMRTLAGATYWLKVSGWNIYGAGQALLTLILNQIFSLYPTQINTWKVQHEIPVFKHFLLIRFYNIHPYVKTIAINEVMIFGIQSTLRWISHMTRPTAVAGPLSADFLRPFLAMSVVRTPLGAAEDLGVLTLLKKGYLPRRAAHYTANLFGLESMVTGLLFSSGEMRWLPIALGVEWSSKFAVWATSVLLHAKSNRLIIIHPKVKGQDLDQIEYVYDVRELPLNAKNVRESTLAEILSKYGFKAPGSLPKSGEDRK